MPGDSVTLDHVGLIIPSLEDTSVFQDLGFTLTNAAQHRRGKEQATESAGSAQRSIMLERGYIELQELTDPEGGHLLSEAKKKRFGLHILALGVADADAARAGLDGFDAAVGDVLAWGRPIAEPDLTGDARFRFFVSDYRAEHEALYCWTEHETPELLRSTRLLAHANTAVALDGLVICVDGDAMAEKVLHRLASSGGTRSDGSVRFGPMTVKVEQLGPPYPADMPSPPFVRDLVLLAQEKQRFAETGARAGFPVSREGDAVVLDLMQRFGIRMVVKPA